MNDASIPDVLRAELIAFGDELIQGDRVNTNSAWLSQQLRLAGVEVAYHTTVGDQLHDSVAALRTAASRVRVIVCTGGLGPTADDLVREAVAVAVGQPLVPDERQLQRIASVFAGRGRSMPDSNRKQAMAPAGSRFIDNPHGTAPGLHATLPQDVHVFALPGVPAEMREMWPGILAALRTLQAAPPAIMQHVVKCFGTGESHLESLISEFTRRDRNPCVGITVHEATISLRIVARGPSDDDCRRRCDETVSQLQRQLGSLVFGEGDDELEDAVVYQLRQHGATLAVQESGTPGWLCHWLRRADPPGHVFRGGMVASDGESSDADRSAGGLARAARDTFNADVGLGLRCTQRDPDSAPTYRVEMAAGEQVTYRDVHVAGHPTIWHPRAAKMALNTLRLRMAESSR